MVDWAIGGRFGDIRWTNQMFFDYSPPPYCSISAAVICRYFVDWLRFDFGPLNTVGGTKIKSQRLKLFGLKNQSNSYKFNEIWASHKGRVC